MSSAVVDAVEHLVRGIVDNPDDVRVDLVTNRRGRTVVRAHTVGGGAEVVLLAALSTAALGSGTAILRAMTHALASALPRWRGHPVLALALGALVAAVLIGFQAHLSHRAGAASIVVRLPPSVAAADVQPLR